MKNTNNKIKDKKQCSEEYRCNSCQGTTRRNSDKKWIKSWCENTGKTSRLYRVSAISSPTNDMKKPTTPADNQTAPTGVAIRRLVRLLRDKPMTCAEIGGALWATPGQGDLSPARYARAAGSLLAKLKKQHIVYDFYNCDRKKRMWEAA